MLLGGSGSSGIPWECEIRGVRPTVRRPPRGHRRGRPVPRSAPLRGYRVDPAGQRVRGRLVVDPPTLEVRPSVLRAALPPETGILDVLEPLGELLVRQRDLRVRPRIRVVPDAHHLRDVA